MDPFWLFFVFLRSSALSLGGQTGLPLLRDDLLGAGVMTDAQIIEGLTIGRLGTGPGGLYIVAIGYIAAGWVGAAVALVAIAIPPLAIVPLASFLRPRLQHRRVNGLIRGLAMTTSGLVIATSVTLLSGVARTGSPEYWQLGLVALGIAAAVEGKRHPVFVIVAGAAIGILLSR